MGDSDEEYDRRRRDKFRGERNDYDNRRPPKGYDRGRGRHDNSWDNRGTKRDYYGNKDMKDRREAIGRNSSPPMKKRRDWYITSNSCLQVSERVPALENF